jgi:hypothetical protein
VALCKQNHTACSRGRSTSMQQLVHPSYAFWYEALIIDSCCTLLVLCMPKQATTAWPPQWSALQGHSLLGNQAMVWM